MKGFLKYTLLILGIGCSALKAQVYNMTNTVVTTCSGNFYDNGGSAANYGNLMNLTQTFTAPGPDERIRVSFSSFYTEANYDSLSVYDGTTTAAPNFMGKYSGTPLPPDQYSKGQSLTFHFVSNATLNNTGWTASVTCFGITSINPASSSQSKTVAITVTGNNTQFQTAPIPNNVFLRHTVTTNTFATAAITVQSNAQLTATFTIPCGADVGQYDLVVEQPGNGATKFSNCFSVNPYQVNFTTNPPSCFGLSNGSISLSPIGGTFPYSYYWQPGSMTTQNVSGLSAGTYTCNVTDGLGCMQTQIVTLTQPPMLSASVSQTNVACFGGANGAASVLATGGTPAYTYNWSPSGGTTSTVNGLAAGNYTCTIVDANGCVITRSVNVTQPAPITVNVGPDQNICAGSVATLSGGVTGGTGPYVYSWIPVTGLSSPTTQNTQASPAATTVYSLMVTDANNCAGNDQLTLTVFPLPNPSASTSGTITCAVPAVTVSATGGTTYMWAGPGIISGMTTANAVVNQPGIYTVTATSAGGCTGTATTAVMADVNAPTVTANGGSICLGSSFVISATGAPAYSWNTGATSASINVSPSSTTVYTVTGANPNGCTSTVTVQVTVYSLPPVLANASSYTICTGATVTLTTSAPTAISYLWSNASTTPSTIVSPTVNTSYTVNVTDVNGCVNSSSLTINVKTNTNISGNIVNETSGNVILYKSTTSLSLWDSVTFVPITAGAYSFTNIDSAQYVVKVLPGTGTNQITYGASEISWQDATIINHGCSNNSVMTVTVVPLVNIGTGTGSMSGQIIEADGFGMRPNGSSFKPSAPGNPIGGIVVKGGRNPGGQMFTQTTTDPTTGTYTLSGIPDGTDYFVLVDIPGLDTNLTYHRDLVAGNNQLTGLDFTVDSMYVNPIVSSVGINDINLVEHQLTVYPNPTSQFININYELKNTSMVNIEMIDVIGKTAKTLLNNVSQTKDKYKQQFSISDLNAGVYFIKLKIDQNESMIKLIITN